MSSDTKTLAVLALLFAAVAGLVAFVLLGERAATDPPPPPVAVSGGALETPEPAPPAAPPSPEMATADAPPTGAAPAAPATPAPDDGWIACAAELPDGEGRLILQQRPNPDPPGELFRRVRLETPGSAKDNPLPKIAGGAGLVNVYWYPREQSLGPFVRIRDREGEYLLTLRSKTLARLLRIRGETYVGVLVDGGAGFGWTEGTDGRIEATVAGREAVRIRGRLADSPGRYLGRFEAGTEGVRFTGAAESPEAPIEKRD